MEDEIRMCLANIVKENPNGGPRWLMGRKVSVRWITNELLVSFRISGWQIAVYEGNATISLLSRAVFVCIMVSRGHGRVSMGLR